MNGEVWKDDLKEFREKTDAFYEGTLDKASYKGFSGGYGSYAQRGGNRSMVRLRMPGGRLTKEKLKFVAESIEKHHIDMAHFTTCQTIQLHNLQPEAIYDVIEHALDVGIVTRGGGGDFPRNVMVSPLSGVEKDEYFDVLPYAEAAGEYLLTFVKGPKLPRKLKVGFSNSPSNQTHATFRDLGFVARKDGSFDVYSAGGLGNNPRFGLKVAEAVEPCKILYYILAMRDTFIAHGNYEKRNKARTRYMQEVLGEEGYREAYQEKLLKVFASGKNLDLDIPIKQVTKCSDGSKAEGNRIIPQKQEGLYAVAYHPVGGCPQPSKFRKLYETVKDMEQVEMRLTPDEGMYIINLTGKEVQKVLEVTADSAQTEFETSIACIGASICQVGLRDSQELLKKVLQAAKEADLKDGALPQIHISGCPSSCGTHQIGSIGFHGCVKMIEKTPHSAFTVHINGCEVQGKEKMGQQLGMMLEAQIPTFLVETGQEVQASGMKYHQWIQEDPERLVAIADKYIVK